MSLKSVITRIFFPLKCPLCGELVPLSDEVCSCCRGELRKVSHDYCIHCAADYSKCSCAPDKPQLDSVAAVCYYSGKARWQIALFKFAFQKNLASTLSLEMSERAAEVFSNVNFDFVTYVPISEKSLEKRGFNQSELLAKGVAERLFVPLQKTLLKIKETEFQHTLGEKERLSNLEGAFGLSDNVSVRGKTVLLCDDIKTTGATLKECSDVLYKNGAEKVCCLVYAVTDYMSDF